MSISVPVLDQFQGLATKFPTHALHFVYGDILKVLSASLVFCLSYKATFNLFTFKKVHLKSVCLILCAFDKNYRRKVGMHMCC